MRRLAALMARAGVAIAAGMAPAAMAQTCPTAPLGSANAAMIAVDGRHDTIQIDRAVLHHVNIARCGAGLRPLSPDPALRQAARMHAGDMARLGFFAHESPVSGRERLRDRVDLAGVTWRRIAENIIEDHYMQYESGASYYVDDARACRFRYADGTAIPRQSYDSMARGMVRRWMASPGHRRNILTPELTRHGFSLAANSDRALCGGIYAVQVFAG